MMNMNIKRELELAIAKNRYKKIDANGVNFVNLAKDCLNEINRLECENLGLQQQVDRYGLQYLDDITNPLEPLKLKSALDSEIFKYNYRKEHKLNDINILDITIMYALKHCLEEQIEKQVDQ